MPTERTERLLQEIEASTSKIIDIEYMLNAERKQRMLMTCEKSLNSPRLNSPVKLKSSSRKSLVQG